MGDAQDVDWVELVPQRVLRGKSDLESLCWLPDRRLPSTTCSVLLAAP